MEKKVSKTIIAFNTGLSCMTALYEEPLKKRHYQLDRLYDRAPTGNWKILLSTTSIWDGSIQTPENL